MVDVICNQILPKVLSTTVSDKMHQFGLFLIDDLIEYIGVELLADKWYFIKINKLLFNLFYYYFTKFIGWPLLKLC